MRPQKEIQATTDPARRMGAIFRAAEDMGLTREDADLLIEKDPERYGCLRYWVSAGEKSKAALPPADLDRDESECCAVGSGYYCSRPSGHDGPHVAHGTRGQELARWESGRETGR